MAAFKRVSPAFALGGPNVARNTRVSHRTLPGQAMRPLSLTAQGMRPASLFGLGAVGQEFSVPSLTTGSDSPFRVTVDTTSPAPTPVSTTTVEVEQQKRPAGALALFLGLSALGLIVGFARR